MLLFKVLLFEELDSLKPLTFPVAKLFDKVLFAEFLSQNPIGFLVALQQYY